MPRIKINPELIALLPIAATLFIGSQPLFCDEIRISQGALKPPSINMLGTTSDCCATLLVAKSKGPSANPGGTKNDEKSNELLKNSPKKARDLLSKIKERSNHAERQLRRAHSRLKENKKEISKIEKQLESSITTIITTTPRSKSSKLNRLKSQLKLSRRKISKNFSLYHKGMRELFLLQRDLERLSKEVEKY